MAVFKEVKSPRLLLIECFHKKSDHEGNIKNILFSERIILRMKIGKTY